MLQHLVNRRLSRELAHQLAIYLVRICEESVQMDNCNTPSRTHAADLALFYLRISS